MQKANLHGEAPVASLWNPDHLGVPSRSPSFPTIVTPSFKDRLPALRDDGLLTPEVGEWAYQKYLRVWIRSSASLAISPAVQDARAKGESRRDRQARSAMEVQGDASDTRWQAFLLQVFLHSSGRTPNSLECIPLWDSMSRLSTQSRYDHPFEPP
jgi:hypothetical protein